MNAASDENYGIPIGFINDIREIEIYKNRKALITLLSDPTIKQKWIDIMSKAKTNGVSVK